MPYHTLSDLPDLRKSNNPHAISAVMTAIDARLQVAQRRHAFVSILWADGDDRYYSELIDLNTFIGQCMTYLAAYRNRLTNPSLTKTHE